MWKGIIWHWIYLLSCFFMHQFLHVLWFFPLLIKHFEIWKTGGTRYGLQEIASCHTFVKARHSSIIFTIVQINTIHSPCLTILYHSKNRLWELSASGNAETTLNGLYPTRRAFHHRGPWKHSLVCVFHICKLFSFPTTSLPLTLENSVSFQLCEVSPVYLHASLCT